LDEVGIKEEEERSEHAEIGKAGRDPEFYDVKLWSLFFFLSSGFDT